MPFSPRNTPVRSVRFCVRLWRLLGLAPLLIGIVVLRPVAGHARPARSSIVIDAASGRVLEAHDANRLHRPASLTKMMTLYLAFAALKSGRVSLNHRFRVSRYAASREPTKLGLRPGQRVRLRNLILGLVTQSANDAAVVIAEGLAGTEWTFAQQMTRTAHALGMRHTVFVNASGLPHPYEHTTARDMATLARALFYRFPHYYRYFATRTFRFRGHIYDNHNLLLGHYRGLDGIKTGFTDAAGYNLVASAVHHGRRLIAVVLGSRTWLRRDRRVVALLNSGFARDRTLTRLARHPPVNLLRPKPEQARTAALDRRSLELELPRPDAVR